MDMGWAENTGAAKQIVSQQQGSLKDLHLGQEFFLSFMISAQGSLWEDLVKRGRETHTVQAQEDDKELLSAEGERHRQKKEASNSSSSYPPWSALLQQSVQA